MSIDEKIGKFIKIIFVIVLAIVFFPALFLVIIPSASSVVQIPFEYVAVFTLSTIFFFIVYLYKLWTE